MKKNIRGGEAARKWRTESVHAALAVVYTAGLLLRLPLSRWVDDPSVDAAQIESAAAALHELYETTVDAGAGAMAMTAGTVGGRAGGGTSQHPPGMARLGNYRHWALRRAPPSPSGYIP